MNRLKFLITGGAGFIGSAVIRHLIKHTKHSVINIDKLTYAANLASLEHVANNARYEFEQIDICDTEKINKALQQYQPDVIMHLAAESHVDRSISNADLFMQTNIIGSYTLLEAARNHHNNLPDNVKNKFRFLHVSTDEVFGDLENNNSVAFTETMAYAPSSPYAASKASSDHLVRAWHRTYGLPIIITNCSNNFGPFQYPEKLIPLVIKNALLGKKIPIYGQGNQVRDWLYVEDHARALILVATKGTIGETYNIGANNEINNLELVHEICSVLDSLYPVNNNPQIKNSNINSRTLNSYAELITHVDDRLGHDTRYAINATKIKQDLGWQPKQNFKLDLVETIKWYLNYYKNAC